MRISGLSLLGLCSLISHVADAAVSRDNLLSLPDIVSGEPTEWSVKNAKFTSTGVVLTESAGDIGSLWSKHKNTLPEWTAVFTFKASGSVESTPGGGLNFWYTASPDKTGPVRGSLDFWDGLGIFLDYEGWDEAGGGDDRGALKAHLNDGSMSYTSLLHGGIKAFSYCRINYRNSAKGITVRVAYKEGQLVVDINGQKCLQSSKIVLPLNEYYFGFSSESTGDKYVLEQFDVYPGFAEEMLSETAKSDVVVKDSGADLHSGHIEHSAQDVHDTLSEPQAAGAISSEFTDTLQEIEKLKKDLVNHMNSLVTQNQNSRLAESSDSSATFDTSPLVNRLSDLEARLNQFETAIQSASTSSNAAFNSKIEALSAHLDNSVQHINENTKKILAATFPDGIDAFHAAVDSKSGVPDIKSVSSSTGPNFWTLLVTFVFLQVTINIGMSKYKERQSRHAKII